MGKVDEVRHYNRAFLFLAEATNFTDFGELFDVSDEGSEEDQLYGGLEVETLLIKFLAELDDRQKIIFLLQIIKEAGYKLTQNDCADILSISKDRYKDSLEKVRIRLKKAYSVSQRNGK